MGQYYRIVNIDKKEVMRPFDFGNGMKLMEWSYTRNYMVLALMNLLSNEWRGDPWHAMYNAKLTIQEINDGDYTRQFGPIEFNIHTCKELKQWMENCKDKMEDLMAAAGYTNIEIYP